MFNFMLTGVLKVGKSLYNLGNKAPSSPKWAGDDVVAPQEG